MMHPIPLLCTRRYETMFGKAEVVLGIESSGRMARLLKIGDSLQSATYIGKHWAELPFEYFRAFDTVFDAEKDEVSIKDILMIGGGGFAWPKHALMTREGIELDVVEIDPAIVDIARKHFYLAHIEELIEQSDSPSKLHVHIGDGHAFLTASRKRYDAILNDSFKASSISDELISAHGVALVKEHLSQGGVYAINYVSDDSPESDYALFCVLDALKGSFENVWLKEAPDEMYGNAMNYIILASDQNHAFRNTIPYA